MLSSTDQSQKVLNYVAMTTGKMLRPTLVLLSFDLCRGSRYAEAINVATGVELVHLASLIHDDIVDNGELRRGQLTVHRRFGTQVAVLAGDHLFAGAFKLFSLSDSKVTQLMTTIIQDMCSGEINQLLAPITVEQQYWNYIYLKTARLIGGCCRLGAILSDQEHLLGDTLQKLGESIGFAFQVTDDVLDYRGSDSSMGKRRGRDFQEQIWTLPIIRAYNRGLIPYDWASMDFETVYGILEAGGIFEEVWSVAASYVQNAIRILDDFPATISKEEMFRLVTKLTRRDT
ncbi:MAG: polyprenyl synthetase family protein [Firmicutes bacterium]|nr:polyprenyl synthetase family protein [Bacillota bacterium]